MTGVCRTFLFALFVVLAAVPVEADRPAAEPTITISAGPDTLQIGYRLKHPIRALELAPAKSGVRSGWTVVSAGIVLDGHTLRRANGSTLDDAVVTLAPDTVRIDRAYPQALRVGLGWLVHGPYLAAAEGGGKARVRVPPDWIALPRKPLTGHFYVGPRSYLRDGIVSPPAIPDALRSTAAAALRQATLSYGRRFALAPPAPPLVVLAVDPTLERGWRGDSTAGALSLRFAEVSLHQPPQVGVIGRFVAHEVFHDWWQGVVAPLTGEKGAWVEEGMAEYAALLTSDDPAAVSTDLTRRLNGCRGSLAPEGLLAAPPTGGEAVYDCGVVFQWLRDLQRRRASGGRDDAFAGWRDLLQRHHRTGVAVEWRAAIAPLPAFAADDAADLLLSPAPDRWPRLVATLNGLGARIIPARGDPDYRVAILKHLLSSVCRERMGFYTQAKNVKLDTGDRCGPLNGDPVVDAIAGHALFGDAAGAFDAVAGLCASGKPVVLQEGGRAVATLACTKPIEPPAERWSVEAWRPPA